MALATLKLEPKRDRGKWFVIRYGKGKQRREIPVGVDSLVERVTLDRVSFELGWIDPTEWDDNQVSWRLDTYEERKPVSVCGYIVVASRKAPKRRFSVTDENQNFTWVPLQALFPDLPAEARFVGWTRAANEANHLELENVDDACMFEKLFPLVYRDYVRILLHLPIAVKGKIFKTVDLRDARPEAFGPLLRRSDTYNPDTMFYAMVTFRVEIGVSSNGKLLAFPRLPRRQSLSEFIELHRHDIAEGTDIVPVETLEYLPNWYALFPIVNSKDYFQVNLATLSYLDPFVRSNFVQRKIFPHSPRNFPTGFINKFYTWRMKWTYTFDKPLAIPKNSKGDRQSYVLISLLRPWY